MAKQKLTKEQLVEELGLGSSQKHIAVKYGITQSAVSQKMKQFKTGGITRHAAKKTEETKTPGAPSEAVLGRAGGSRTFGSEGNETFNPDNIALDTYRRMTYDAQLRA